MYRKQVLDPGHFPPDSGSSTQKYIEPKIGNDDFDSWKNLATVLIVVLVFTLVFLFIFVLCTGKYILTDKSVAFPKRFFPGLKIFTDSSSSGKLYFQSNIVQTIKNSALDLSENCEPPIPPKRTYPQTINPSREKITSKSPKI